MTKTPQSQAAEPRGELGVPLLRGNSQRKNRLIPTATDFLSMDQHHRGDGIGSQHQQQHQPQPRSGNGGNGSNKTLGLYCILFLVFWFSRENVWGTLEGMWLRDAATSVEEGDGVAARGDDDDDGRLGRGRTRTTDKYVPAALAEMLVADGVPRGPPPSPRNPKDGMVLATEEKYTNVANDQRLEETRKDDRRGRRLLRLNDRGE